MLSLSATEAAAALGVIVLASSVQGSLGFGAALIASPVLLLIDPGFAPGPILISNLVLTLLILGRELSEADWSGIRFVVPPRIVTTSLAALVLTRAPGAVFDLVFGALVLAAVALSAFRGGFRSSPVSLAVAGAGAGVMGTLSGIGGPPLALVYQGEAPSRFRATLGLHLALGTVISLVAVYWAGRFGTAEAGLASLLLPGTLLGFWLSRFGLARIDARHVRVAVLGLSTLAALTVLARAATR